MATLKALEGEKKQESSIKSVELADPCKIFAELETNVRRYLPNHDLSVLRRAYEFGAECHKNQKRRSGEQYITHPLEVANILTSLNLDLHSIVAAILHDTVEDTPTTLADIEREFGSEVAGLVDGLTKISRIEFRSSQEKMAENFRKMILAMANDLRVILIKLADRLHNMRTISHMPHEKSERIAQETMEIYAPLANRLGIYGIKNELEDLCLRVLKKEIYQSIRKKIAAKRTERQAYIDDVIRILDTELRKYGFQNAKVYGRPKHFYSIYKKMIDRHLEYEDIHDLFAFRIIVDNLKDCYEALGVVHAMWKPMPGRFKDYIAMPKANLYQSLHTTVIRPNGEPAEIQIRTREMHDICEFGVAAHWAYKEGQDSASLGNADLRKFSWLRQIVQWQSELQDPNEFLEAVKVDLFDEEIFLFTPKEDVISLPHKASALDFAFAVHTDVGLKTIGAKVNGRMVPIKKILASGDIVEILTSPNQKPRKDWLNFVITSKARNKIRSALRSDQRNRSYTIGEDLMRRELEHIGLNFDYLQKHGHEEQFAKLAREGHFHDVLVAIGYGKVDAKELLRKVFPKKFEKDEKLDKPEAPRVVRKKKPSNGVLVSGLEDILVNFGKCCNPLPGEDITGFVTRGRGVTVHRTLCPRSIDLDPARQIEVSWASEEDRQTEHSIFLRILTKDRKGALAEITGVIANSGANIQKADVRVGQDLLGVLDFELGLTGFRMLQSITNKIEQIQGVVSVERKNILKSKVKK